MSRIEILGYYIIFLYTSLSLRTHGGKPDLQMKAQTWTSEDRKVIGDGKEDPRKVQMLDTKLIMYHKIDDVYGEMSWFITF